MNLDEARRRVERATHLNAFIALTAERGPGPAIAVKDLIDVRGVPTTGGGAILPRAPAADDAPLIRRIRAAGCRVLGKTNLYEWAYGVSSCNPHFGDVSNPRDPARSAGGSSSGSAAAVAAGLCDWAIGTDTAGSVRVPASLCGVVGFKPSHGAIPTDGVIPLSRSLDTVGALAPTVRVATEAVALMSGGLASALDDIPDVQELRLVSPGGWVADLDEETARVWGEIGDRLPRVPLPDRAQMAEAAVTIQAAEASAFHRDWVRRWPDRYSAEVLAKLEAGLDVRAVDYLRALEERVRLRGLLEEALEGRDALVLPATAVIAPPIDAPEAREALLRFTRPFSLTGHPCIVIPAPTAGLPVGIQLVGGLGAEAGLAVVAMALERSWDATRGDVTSDSAGPSIPTPGSGRDRT